MQIGTRGKMAVVGALAFLAVLIAGCGSGPGSNEIASNETAALKASSTLPTGAPCTVGGEACATGDYCAQSATSGVCTSAGVCTVRPTLCQEINVLGASVCGCNGNTYASACYAEYAGTAVAHPGPCTCDPESTSTSEGTACAKGYYCDTSVGANDACGTSGTCTFAETFCAPACVLGHEQFCGCNGVTYDGCNQCLVQEVAPVKIAYAGACK